MELDVAHFSIVMDWIGIVFSKFCLTRFGFDNLVSNYCATFSYFSRLQIIAFNMHFCFRGNSHIIITQYSTNALKLHPYFSFNCCISFIPDGGLRISRNIE